MKLPIKSLIIAVCLTALVVGCEKLVPEEIIPTRDTPTFTMTLEVMPAEKINEFCKKLGVTYDNDGCAAFNLETNHCTIYVPQPRHAHDTERFAIVGHEVWHCRFGVWHQ